MEGLILGMDLCDDYSRLCCFRPEEMKPETISLNEEGSSELIPTVICKKKGEDSWLIGEEAYRLALYGGGTMVDKLVKLLRKEGSATIEGVKYQADELIAIFFRKLLEAARHRYGQTEIISLVLTVQTLEGRFLDQLIHIAETAGVPRRLVHILSHTESYVYYVLSQEKQIWTGENVLFDLTENGLFYYDMKVIRGRRPQMAEASHEKLEEGFSLDVLDTAAGEKLGDTILTACADRLFKKRLISSVFLTGKGFENTSWAPHFLKTICSKRRVFAEQNIFAAGAAYRGFDGLQPVTSYPYTMLCEGRIQSTVSLAASVSGRKEQVVLALAGSNWYESKSSAEFILDDVPELELVVTPVIPPCRSEKIRVSLDELPARPVKTTRIEVIISFTGEKCMTVRIIDKGFGDLFPASGKMIRRDFYLS